MPSGWEIPHKTESLAYMDERYAEMVIPKMIFVPRVDMMFKMMRACIKVKDPSEFWFNN